MLIQRNIIVPKKSKKSTGKHRGRIFLMKLEDFCFRCDFLAYFHISYFSEDL